MQIAIYGAGAVGCYLGAVLHLEGLQVSLIGRSQMRQHIHAAGGIHISDYLGNEQLAYDIHFTDQQRVLGEADLVLVTVKCHDINSAADAIRHHCRPGTRVICLQTGLGCDQILQRRNPELFIRRGIVAFNITQLADAHFHRSTAGGVHLEQCSALLDIQDALEEQQIDCWLENDFDAVAWAWLQLNLNNAINALAGLPIQQQLQQRPFRKLLSMAIAELNRVARRKRISPARLTALPASLIPWLLRTPDAIFQPLAQRLMTIDTSARSSMWQDIQQQQLTEIDYLNGAVCREGQQLGIQTPVNRLLVTLVRQLERGERQPGISAEEMLLQLTGR